MLVELDGEPHIVQEVLSKGAGGPARAKLMNTKSGKIIYRTWEAGATFEYLATESRSATYSYFDGSDSRFVFYDVESCEEFRVSSETLGDAGRWLVEGVQVDLKLFDGAVIKLGFRGDVVFEVTEFANTNRVGNDAAKMRYGWDTGTHKNRVKSKRVLLSNGETVNGPKYLQIGDRVVVDPETSQILRRL